MRKVLEGELKHECITPDAWCSAVAQWAYKIGATEIYNDEGYINEIFEPFVGKYVRIVIDEIDPDSPLPLLPCNTCDVITGEDAIKLYNDLMNPKPNPKRAKIIEDALKEFPNPGEPAVIQIELDDYEKEFLDSL